MEAIRFGAFELDPQSGELRRDGSIVPLAPQPFRLLLALASRPGELVTREELREKVWSDGTYVDFERGLNFCILQVRTALGDDAKHPAFIETLPRRGYRFVGAVEGPRVDEQPLRETSRRFAIFAVIAAAIFLFVTGVAWERRAAMRTPEKIMIAVLPFDDLSATRQPHFADGLTEELITRLGQLQPKRLGVIARTSILNYRGTTKSVRAIGRELGVHYIIEGSVRREGGRVRIAAQLIETAEQTHRWAESFDRDATGALRVQEEIAEQIADALRLQLLDEHRSLTARSAAAHDIYLRARYLWNQRRTEDVEQSVNLLREAIRIEPDFVLAHVALAESLHALAMRDRIAPGDAAKEIRQASENALRLAPSLAQSHAITAMLHFWYDWNWDAAESSYRRAIELNPNEPGALHDHGWLLITRGRFDEGIAEIRRAQELDPVSPRANMHVAWAYIYTRRYPLAIGEARRALELSPGFEEALACIEFAQRLAGDRPKSVTIPDVTNVRDPYNAAARLALAGDSENALNWLAVAKSQRNTSFALAGIDPKLESLHDDLRFQEMLASAGLRALKPPIR